VYFKCNFNITDCLGITGDDSLDEYGIQSRLKIIIL